MDDPLRHWPLFVTGLLLGATGAMSLGLHRPTDAERAAAARAPVVVPAAAPAVAVAAAAVVARATASPDAGSAERVEEQMRAAAESFRSQEARAPYALALAPKPRVRRVVKEAEPQDTIAIAPNPAPEPSE